MTAGIKGKVGHLQVGKDGAGWTSLGRLLFLLLYVYKRLLKWWSAGGDSPHSLASSTSGIIPSSLSRLWVLWNTEPFSYIFVCVQCLELLHFYNVFLEKQYVNILKHRCGVINIITHGFTATYCKKLFTYCRLCSITGMCCLMMGIRSANPIIRCTIIARTTPNGYQVAAQNALWDQGKQEEGS